MPLSAAGLSRMTAWPIPFPFHSSSPTVFVADAMRWPDTGGPWRKPGPSMRICVCGDGGDGEFRGCARASSAVRTTLQAMATATKHSLHLVQGEVSASTAHIISRAVCCDTPWDFHPLCDVQKTMIVIIRFTVLRVDLRKSECVLS